MAPVKFGLFKARSRDHQEQPSTENLLQDNTSYYNVPDSSAPSTSTGLQEDLSLSSISKLTLDSDDDELPSERSSPVRQGSDGCRTDAQKNYELLSLSSICEEPTGNLKEDYDQGEQYEMEEMHRNVDLDPDSTSCDANSSVLDVTSITASELSIRSLRSSRKKEKKRKLKEEKLKRDRMMWQASDFEVMQHLMTKSGTTNELIKWEAIATSRGLCTLNDSCNCSDCVTSKYLVGISDGGMQLDAGHFLSAIANCSVQ